MPFTKGHKINIGRKRFDLVEIAKKMGIANKGKHYSISTEFKKGQIPWNKDTKGVMKAWNKGLKGFVHAGTYKKGHHSVFKGKTDEQTPGWVGDKIKYFGLHTWVRKKLGKPLKCEHCGIENLRPRQYHWANKSREYKRDLSDWLRLCVKCHRKYDRG